MQKNKIAVIDLGSNSFHLIIAETDNKKINYLERRRNVVQITSTDRGSFSFLSDEGIQRGLEVLKDYNRLIKIHDAEVYAYATSAIRDAENKNEFFKKAKSLIEFDINILSEEEEARLSFGGAIKNLNIKDKKCCVFDIGGGSTEITTGKGYEIETAKSYPLGAVRLTKMFLFSDIISDEQISNCTDYVKKVFSSDKQNIKGIEMFIGTAGTVQAVARIYAARFNEDFENKYIFNNILITDEFLKTIYAEILNCRNKKELIRIKGLNPDRIEIATAGMIILKEMAEIYGIKSFIVSSAALKEGILFDIIEKKARSQN